MDDDLLDELAGLRSTQPDPRHRPDPVVLRRIVAELRAVKDESRSFGIAADFLLAMTREVVECFRRLDRLPRDDPFWEGTNRRPTQYKMSDFCRKLADESPEDGQARLMQAAVQVLVGHGFEPTAWGRLVSDGLADAAWPVYAALIGLRFGGYDTTPGLVRLLEGLGLSGGVRLALDALARAGEPSVREWVEEILDRCKGRSRPAR